MCILSPHPVSIIRTSFLQENRSPNKYCKDRPKGLGASVICSFSGIYIKLNSSLCLFSKLEFLIDDLWCSWFLVCDGWHEEKTTYNVISYYQVQARSACLTMPVSLTDDVLRQRIMTLFGNLAD